MARRAPSFASLSDEKKPMQVADALEQSILRGDFRPGERIPTELELAAQMEVSRTVIRDAARILATKGLLEVRQGSGTVVASPTSAAYADTIDLLLARSACTIADAYEARAVLDRQLASVVVRNATEADLDDLERAAVELEEAVAARNWKAAETAHVDFHVAYLSSLHLPVLEVLLVPIQQVLLTDPPRFGDASHWYTEEHHDVARAARTRDQKTLEDAVDRHYAFIGHDAFHEFKELPLGRASIRRKRGRAARAKRRTS
jgi:DNA-binding FadR family transcriptional regulator